MGTHWVCALWPCSLPHFGAQVEDGKGDRRQEDGRSSLPQVERDGRMFLSTSAAACVRHIQELRGPLPCCLHGWQRCGDAWKSDLMRAEGGWRQGWRQEEVRGVFLAARVGTVLCVH